MYITLALVPCYLKEVKNAGRIKHCEIIIIIIVHNASIAGYSATYDKIVNVMNAYDEDELKNMDPPASFDMSWDVKTGYKTKQLLAAPHQV